MRVAVVDEGVVTNIIEAPECFKLPGLELIEADEIVSIGWTFDEKTFHPSKEKIEEARYASPFDFRLLFTQPERIAIYGSEDGLVRDFIGALQTITTQVDLQAVETQQAVGYLALMGLIKPERVAQILSGQPPE